jgi:CBS domain-containing protein
MEPVESPVRAGEVNRIDAVSAPVRAWIAAIDDPLAVDGYQDRAVAAAGALMQAGAGALATSRMLTSLHDALTVRLIRLAVTELGPPPGEYAWLTLGSGGRMEQSLRTDQDNALAYAERGEAADDYFATLGARVVAGLARAGLGRCPGGYMADRWHQTLAQWRELFGSWVDRPVPQALVEAEVFLDFRCVAGDLSVAPLEAALHRGSGAPRFLVGMARAAVVFSPPLGFGGRIRTERGEVDLKRGGLAAVVLLARLYALAAGSPARSTVDRLAAAAAAGTLSRHGADALAEAYRVLADLRMAAQLGQLAAGGEPTNRARLADLTRDNRAELRRALYAVRDLQRATAMRFRTDTVL